MKKQNGFKVLYISLFLKVFPRNDQHPKTFAIFFPQMFMMHLMSPSNSTCVPIVGISKQLETLVYKDIMNGKISQTVGENPQANRQSYFKDVVLPKQKEANADHSIKDKERVVALEPRVVVFLMMICVEFP